MGIAGFANAAEILGRFFCPNIFYCQAQAFPAPPIYFPVNLLIFHAARYTTAMLTELSNTNALEIPCDAIAHGVNMRGAMAGGIARQIALMFPEAEAEYIWNCKWDLVNIGGCLPIGINDDKDQGPYTLYNLFTQVEPGADARLDALEKSLEFMTEEAAILGVKDIAMPRIGCGIGGLEWDDVRPIMLKMSEGYNFIVCTL